VPTYVYKFVESGETIEVQQAFADDSLTQYTHPETGDLLPVKKVFQPVGVTFKGSGFFKTDNRGSQATTPPGSSPDSSSGSDSGSDSGSSTSKDPSSSSTSKDSSSSTSSPKESSSKTKPSTTTSSSSSSSD
jgi:predicted nucleic acid-binding Zn ribbon protein